MTDQESQIQRLLVENSVLKSRLRAHEKEPKTDVYIVKMMNDDGTFDLIPDLTKQNVDNMIAEKNVEAIKNGGRLHSIIWSINKQADSTICDHDYKMQRYCDHSDRNPWVCEKCGNIDWR